MRFKQLIGALVAAAVLASPAAAKTLRWSSQGDILTFDPMAQNESLNNTFSDYVYDGLVRYNKQFVPEPALATSWTRVSPTQWRFNLRKNVKFHDGTPMTADDVVFSFERVLKPASNMKVYAQGIKETKKIDDFTVEIITDGPNPVLLRGLVDVKVMSKAWSTKNNVVNPQNYAQKEESYAARNTNGTGQFMLKSREAGCAYRAGGQPELVGQGGGQRHRDRLPADQAGQHARGRAAVGRGRPRARPADAGHSAAAPEQRDQDRRRYRDADDLLRLRPVARRVAVHERQGQEPVQGQARPPGDVPGDRHRGDPHARRCAGWRIRRDR